MPLLGRQAKEPGRCIFCGGLGLTKEHLWADWLRRYLPRQMPRHTTRGAFVHPHLEDQIAIERRSGDFYSRRVRCVCATCNNGWMSRLQSSAKPFLIPFLTGQPTSLNKRERRIISAWIAMMVMVGEYATKEFIAIPERDRLYLRREQKPPSHWRIWIGAHNCQEFPLYSHNVLSLAKEKIEGAPDDFVPPPNTQTTTICLGDYLVIYVMSSIIAREYVRRWVLPPQIGRGMLQIWPIGIRSGGDVRWAPFPRLTDKGLALLANHFFDRGTELAARR
jgi:hypothetical protein